VLPAGERVDCCRCLRNDWDFKVAAIHHRPARLPARLILATLGTSQKNAYNLAQ
jgi:hypothetical protein